MWLQNCRIDNNDYLLSKNASYVLKRTKKQIFLLNDHTDKKIDSSKNNDTKINSSSRRKNVMNSKNSRYGRFKLAPKALIYGFESLQQVYDMLWPTSSTSKSLAISQAHIKRNLYVKRRRRRSSVKRSSGIL